MNIHEDERLKEMLINILNKILIHDPPNVFSSADDNLDIINTIEKKIFKYLYYICEDYDVELLLKHRDPDNDVLTAIDYAIKCDNTAFIMIIEFAEHRYLEISDVDESYYYSEDEKKKIIKELFNRE
jgi:hypothetical protein